MNANAQLDAIILRRERKTPFTLYAEMAATARKEWLVKNFLGAGEQSAVYGVPGCGKSVLIEDAALHISAGIDWHGRAVQQGAVLYIALERKHLVERRAIAFRQKHGLQNLPFALLGGVFDFRQPATIATVAEVARQVETETGFPVVLIVIDTISRALCGGDENSSKDMGALVAATGALNAQTRAHVLWVHHMPQDGAERLRGHGALLGAMDTTIHVEKLGDGLRTATVVKTNDADEGERVAFTLESVEIGPETTAPVVVAQDAPAATSSKPKRKLSARDTLALAALTETVLAHGRPAPGGLELPQTVRVVALDQWKEEMFTRNVLDRSAANPRTDFRRIVQSLQGRGLIGTHDELAWSAADSYCR